MPRRARALLTEIQRDAAATADTTGKLRFSERVIGAMDAVPRHLFVPAREVRRRLCEPTVAHWPRSDHFATIHRGIDDRIAGAGSR